jgi:actin related protein 2/3 complex subunit 2
MILLDYHNKIVEDTLLEKFNNPPGPDGKWEYFEMILADFDGVTFHLATDQNTKNLLRISVSIKCFAELKKHDVEGLLKQQYPGIIDTPENGYDVTLKVDLASPPADKEKFARNVALLKRNCFAAPFYKVFNDVEAKKAPGGLIELPYRDNEAIYIKPEADRCIVIFAMQFKDPDDVVLAKVFLQEYQDARRTMSNAPSVTYSQKEPPLELKGVKGLKVGDNNGFVSFVLFQPHVTGKKKDSSVDNVMTFRNYLHYHIKCSKAFLHTRMRNRVRSFLQVLNRARSEQGIEKEKKTMSGKSFKRSDDPQQESQEFNI